MARDDRYDGNSEEMFMMGDDGDGDDGGDYSEDSGDSENTGKEDAGEESEESEESGDEENEDSGSRRRSRDEDAGEDHADEEGVNGEESAVEEDVFGSRDDFENIDDEWFDDDAGDWSAEDYDELAGELFGDNEYYGDTADQQYEDEGFLTLDKDEEYREKLSRGAPGAFDTFRFFNQGGKVVPRGFLTIATLALLRSKFPNLNLGLLKVVLPGELFKKERSKPQPLPPELRSIDPHDTVDLRKYCSPVGDQGQTGRCKAYALTHAWELLHRTQSRGDVILACSYAMMQNQKTDGTFSDFEAAFRAEDGTQMGAEHAASLSQSGLCVERLWKNDSPTPSAAQKEMDADAAKNRLAVKALPIALDDAKKVLSQGYPIQFAMATGTGFQSIGRDGVYRVVEEPTGMHGGHAMLIVGYFSNFFIVKNSWGEEWGDHGYCYIPKAVLQEAGWEFIAVIPAAGPSAAQKR